MLSRAQRSIMTTTAGRTFMWRAYHNNGNGTFSDISAQAGAGITKPLPSRGLAVADFWNNGQLSVLLANMNATPALLVNSVVSRNPWVELRTIGTKSNRDGIGAKTRFKWEREPGGRSAEWFELHLAE